MGAHHPQQPDESGRYLLARVQNDLFGVHCVLSALLPVGRQCQPVGAGRPGHIPRDGVLRYDVADVHGLPFLYADEGIPAGRHQCAVQQHRYCSRCV